MRQGLPRKRNNVVQIGTEVIRQSDLVEYLILEGDLIAAKTKLEAKRMQLAAALLRGAEIEDGQLRTFLTRHEKVKVDSSIVRTKLIVR